MRIKVVTMKNRSNGVALVIALILLFMLTILGVASMSGVSMQERMAGNVNLQTLAFEAASAGVGTSLKFFDTSYWPIDEEGNAKQCKRGSGEWQTANWVGPFEFKNVEPADDLTVEYFQRVGCFEPNADAIPEHWKDPNYRVPTQLLVLNKGVVRSGGETLAEREVEVRLEKRGDGSQCAIQVTSPLDTIDIAGGGPAVDGGEGGCPISVPDKTSADALKAEIGEAHVGEYQPNPPGITESEGHAPWNNPQEFAKVVDDLKTAVLGYEDYKNKQPLDAGAWRDGLKARIGQPGEPEHLARVFEFVVQRDESWTIDSCRSKFYAGSVRIGQGNIPGGQCDIDWGSDGSNNKRFNYTGADAVVGDPDPDPDNAPFFTYIAGNLGNPSNNNGSGIVIIEGGNCWSGTADFQGLQIIAGGHFEIIGGGGGDTTGAIIMSKLADRYGVVGNSPEFWEWGDKDKDKLKKPLFDADNPPKAEFEGSGLVFRGGGNHTIDFSCGGKEGEIGLTEYIGQINACLETNYKPNCNSDGGLRDAIASWREYVDREKWIPVDLP